LEEELGFSKNPWHPRVQKLIPRTSCSISIKTLYWYFLHGAKTEIIKRDKQESKQASSVHKYMERC